MKIDALDNGMRAEIMIFLINKNGHFFKIKNDLLNLSALQDVSVFDNSKDASLKLGMNEKEVLDKSFEIFLDDLKRPYTIMLGNVRAIDLSDCEFNNNGVICRCYSLEDYVNEFSL